MAEAVPAPGAEHLVPAYHYQQTLVAAEDMEGGKYLVSPITLQLSETELLVSYKRGFSHAFDHEADFDLLWLDPVTQRTRRRLSSRTPEIVRFEYDWAEVK